MSNVNGIYHVITKELGTEGGKACCGRTVFNEDKPMSIQHARACIEKKTRIRPCKKCMKAYDKESSEGGK